mmetsp:Transcript_1935/g.3876  ORF Transcript_1935/g.3876 Transcript_1935/m.3876 type:complete len:804 (-) Transcript_1935:16-2427(-)
MSQLIRIRRVSRGPRLSLLFSSRNTQERCKSSVVSTAQGREFSLLSKDEYNRHDRPDSIGSLRGASLANGSKSFMPTFDLKLGFAESVRTSVGGVDCSTTERATESGGGFISGQMERSALIPPDDFKFDSSRTLIEKEREDEGGRFISSAGVAAEDDRRLTDLMEMLSKPLLGSTVGGEEDQVAIYRNRNDRKSKLFCMLNDYSIAPLAKWRLNQSRGKRKRKGWHPSVPLRFINRNEEKGVAIHALESMSTYNKAKHNEAFYEITNEIVEDYYQDFSLKDCKHLLQQCALAGDNTGCEKIMRLMAELKIEPDQECFFHWVNGCSESNPEQGLKIVNHLLSMPNSAPASNLSVNLCNLYLQLLFDTNVHFSQSIATLERMKNEGTVPNAVTYSIVIKSLTHANEIEKSWEIFEEMHQELYMDMMNKGLASKSKEVNSWESDSAVATLDDLREMNFMKTENQQDCFVNILQMLKNTKPRLPQVVKRGRNSSPNVGISNVEHRGMIFTAKEDRAEWEDQNTLELRIELAKQIFRKFEQLNYDFHALGRIHFTGFVCLMQLLLKDGMLEEVVRLFLVGIGKNRKTMNFNQKNFCAVHAMDAAMQRKNPEEALEVIRVLDDHFLHKNEIERKRSIKELRDRWDKRDDEASRGDHDGVGGDEFVGEIDKFANKGKFKGNEDESFGFETESGIVKEIVNPRFLFNGYSLAISCQNRQVALEICNIMDNNLRLKKEEKLRSSMRARAEELKEKEIGRGEEKGSIFEEEEENYNNYDNDDEEAFIFGDYDEKEEEKGLSIEDNDKEKKENL